MKKFLIITMAAMLAASCSFESTETNRRTKENLAGVGMDLLTRTSDFAVTMLSSIDNSEQGDIFADGFDTTVVSSYYGYSIYIARGTADSTWIFSNSEDGAVVFNGTVEYVDRDTHSLLKLKADFSGSYDEGNGYSASFASDGPIDYSWVTRNDYYSGYNGISYTLARSGKMKLATFYDDYEGASLDEITIKFDKTDYSW